ncbi:unnamed protein product [Paramecium pentaurelia]|uniref:Uncharacterized protein n=1 Tax=Paramecium pentaurelia TaxID=43138 RepID=A0A8S1VDX9_9CILI|nr:unnamed protein product [Paramecium pentaurelia]
MFNQDLENTLFQKYDLQHQYQLSNLFNHIDEIEKNVVFQLIFQINLSIILSINWRNQNQIYLSKEQIFNLNSKQIILLNHPIQIVEIYYLNTHSKIFKWTSRLNIKTKLRHKFKLIELLSSV